MKRPRFLLLHLWRRIRRLRRNLRASEEQRCLFEGKYKHCLARVEELQNEIERLKKTNLEEVERMGRIANEMMGKAAAEHYEAYEWAENYKTVEFQLTAARAECALWKARADRLTENVKALEVKQVLEKR
jgi:predicted nuclease with TOPRIM domain